MVRVIIERRCRPGKEAELETLLVELRTRAMRQPGYISGETLRGDTLRTVTPLSGWSSAHGSMLTPGRNGRRCRSVAR